MNDTQHHERLLDLILYFGNNDNASREIDEYDEFLDERILENILDMPLSQMNLNLRCHDRRSYDDLYGEELVENHQSQPMETILEVILFTNPPYASKLVKTMIEAGADADNSVDEYRLFGLLEDMKPDALNFFRSSNIDSMYMLYYIVEAKTKPFSETLFLQILRLFYYMLSEFWFFDYNQEENFLFYFITQKLFSIGQQMPAQILAHPKSNFWLLYNRNCNFWRKVMIVMCLEKKGLSVSFVL